MKKIVISLVLGLAACNTNDPNAAAAKEHAKMLVQDLKGGSPAVAKPTPQEIPVTATNPQAAASVREGIALLDNVHHEEALELFRKAAALDPACVSASAFVGFATPGVAGNKLIEAAVAKAGALPQVEQDHLATLLAFRAGDPLAGEAAAKKLVTSAPNLPRAHVLHAQSLAMLQRFDDAIAEAQAAVELDPSYGVAHNAMAYAYLGKGKTDDAITHLKKYAELAPKEANAQDSLGEALLGAGKFDEAEAAFVQAAALDPKFSVAWQGVAISRMFRNDLKGALDAFAKQKAAAGSEVDKIGSDGDLALSQLAAGKPDDAGKTLAAQEKAANAAKFTEMAFDAAIRRAFVLDEAGKHQDALRALAPLSDMIAKSDIPAATKTRLQAYRLNVEISAEAAQAKKADAGRALAATEALAKAAPDDVMLKDAVAFAHGEEALSRGDAKAAVSSFHGCTAHHDWCHYAEMRAAEKAGDKAAADAVRTTLAKTWRRDGMSVLIHAKLGPAGKS